MANQQPRDFEAKVSNIEEYIDKTIVVADVKIDVGDNMTITELVLDNGDVVSTTSQVIAKQAEKAKADGLPIRVKIVSQKAQKGKFSYFTFAAPDTE